MDLAGTQDERIRPRGELGAGARRLLQNAVRDMLPDRDRRRGRRTRRVQYMQRARTLDQMETLHECAVGEQCLGPHAGTAGFKVRFLNLRNLLPESGTKHAPTEGTPEFAPDHPGVPSHESPESPAGDRINKITRVNLPLRIALPGKRQNRVWPRFDFTFEESGKMDAEEWIGRIRNRVEEIADEMLG